MTRLNLLTRKNLYKDLDYSFVVNKSMSETNVIGWLCGRDKDKNRSLLRGRDYNYLSQPKNLYKKKPK